MAAVNSTMLPLGTPAPDFRLPNTDGALVARDDFRAAPALLVMFICNHCPYVMHIRARSRGVRPRLPGARPGDGRRSTATTSAPTRTTGPEKMAEERTRAGYVFPYLYDATQAVARAYRAACTPDFFLFDRDRRLVYRGQFDDSRPGNDRPVTGADLRAAADAVLAGRPPGDEQRPSIGCNIKWKPGAAPDYFGR